MFVCLSFWRFSVFLEIELIALAQPPLSGSFNTTSPFTIEKKKDYDDKLQCAKV